MTLKNPDLEIEIDTDETYESIVLTMKSEERTIVIGFDLQQAQMLTTMLSEAVSNLLLHKLDITPPTPGTRH